MIKAEEIINEKKNKNLTDLEVEYFKENKNPEFKKFTQSINLNDKILMKYTSSLKQCFDEKENCKNCKGIENCKNEIQEIEKEALEERKSKAITLLQELPNETICEIVNHFEERLKTGESENKK